MARIRTNNVFGNAAALTDTDTTLSSPGLANLPAISSPDIAVIVHDPDRIGGAPETLHVTAHTAGATTATILRGQEGTTARAHAADTPWVHTATKNDWASIGRWTLIEERSLAADTASETITFGADYKALRVTVDGELSAADSGYGFIRFNGDAGNNYVFQVIVAFSSTIGTNRNTNAQFPIGRNSTQPAGSPVFGVAEVSKRAANKPARVSMLASGTPSSVASDVSFMPWVGVWNNTAALLQSITVGATGSAGSQLAAGTVVVVEGVEA